MELVSNCVFYAVTMYRAGVFYANRITIYDCYVYLRKITSLLIFYGKSYTGNLHNGDSIIEGYQSVQYDLYVYSQGF